MVRGPMSGDVRRMEHLLVLCICDSGAYMRARFFGLYRVMHKVPSLR